MSVQPVRIPTASGRPIDLPVTRCTCCGWSAPLVNGMAPHTCDLLPIITGCNQCGAGREYPRNPFGQQMADAWTDEHQCAQLRQTAFRA